ncbi:hypothetical protein C7N43_03065 [Sphingobacteriales bacterium UPWRP_1]|nr:hypothetical protein BVG80_09565 [Sphingobacteriales bacterium TSM_CSM]PSJ78598.1 hypothetical protein C7N43_03065 [Sphingobacteriales bacterium UPWRP_1]
MQYRSAQKRGKAIADFLHVLCTEPGLLLPFCKCVPYLGKLFFNKPGARVICSGFKWIEYCALRLNN